MNRSTFILTLLCMAALGFTLSATAATLTVTSNAGDTSAGSLRGQIAAAADGDTIEFDPSVTEVALAGITDGRSKSVIIDGDLGNGDRVRLTKEDGNYAILASRGTTWKNTIFDGSVDDGAGHSYFVLVYTATATGYIGEGVLFENCKFIPRPRPGTICSHHASSQVPTDPTDASDDRYPSVIYRGCQFEGDGVVWDGGETPAISGQYGINLNAEPRIIDYLLIEDCHFMGLDAAAINLDRHGSYIDVNKPTKQAIIRNNVFEGTGVTGHWSTNRAIMMSRLYPDENSPSDTFLTSDVLIENNVIYKHYVGIDVLAEGTNGVRIEGNDFGPTPDAKGVPASYDDWGGYAIFLRANAKEMTIGGEDPSLHNTFAYQAYAGIYYGAEVNLNPESVQVLGNSFYDIDSYDSDSGTWNGNTQAFRKAFTAGGEAKAFLDGDGGLAYLNNAMAPKPVVSNVDASGVSGNGVNPGATVRLWTSGPRPAEAKAYTAPAGIEMETYQGATVADGSGNWSFAVDLSGMMDGWVSLLAVNADTGDYPYQTSQLTALPITGEAGDRDMDGQMDWWEEMYGLSTMDAAGVNGPLEDVDVDGYTNGAEHDLLLTDGLLSDPTDPNSNPGDPDNLQGLPAVSMLTAAFGLGAIALAAARRKQ